MRTLRKSLLIAGLIFIVFVNLHAQRRFSIAAGTGTAYYYGDLTDNFTNSFFRPALQISGSAYLLPVFSLRLGVSYGLVGASDAQASSETRRLRNLHFRSPVGEVSLTGVYEFIPDRNFGVSWRNQLHFSPYIFGGIAVFGFDPRAEYEGEWVRLRPLGTEGQYIGDNGKRPYSFAQAAIPFGGGVSLRVSDFIGISLEAGYRITFTDYLDDVSTMYPEPDALIASGGALAAALSNRTGGPLPANSIRGNPGVKDSYVFTTFSVVYYLERNR
ncbi:MAG: DUF6089 family protein [Bacteroidia bacterium]